MSANLVHQLQLDDADATAALAWRLADAQPAGGAVVHLHGDLGAGKSTLARAWLRRLGVQGTVRSPTYTLVERYPLANGGDALHLDLYRIADPGELEFLGLDEAAGALWLVEWPQRGAGALPPADLAIHLALGGDGREACIEACSVVGRDWITRYLNSEVVTVS